MTFREPGYAILSAVLAMVTLVFGMLAGLFVLAGIRGPLNQAIPHNEAGFNAILICFIVDIVFAFQTVVCVGVSRTRASEQRAGNSVSQVGW